MYMYHFGLDTESISNGQYPCIHAFRMHSLLLEVIIKGWISSLSLLSNYPTSQKVTMKIALVSVYMLRELQMDKLSSNPCSGAELPASLLAGHAAPPGRAAQ